MNTYYIGMILSGGEYRWTDGTPVTFANWATDPGIKNCVGMLLFNAINTHGQWVTDYCYNAKRYIVYYK